MAAHGGSQYLFHLSEKTREPTRAGIRRTDAQRRGRIPQRRIHAPQSGRSRVAPGLSRSVAGRVPRSDRPARVGRIVLQRNLRDRARTCRHRDVAPRASPQTPATMLNGALHRRAPMNRGITNCETARRLMETNDPALAEHLLSCLSCIMRTQASYYEAPPGLEEKIRRNLRREDPTPSPWRWMAIAASVLLVVSVGWNIALFRSRVDPRELLASNVLSAHIRSLSGTHLLDVP